ncbi:baseplate assembly protein [Yersinia mollaretii]|uniref:baseplate assembly protein n=1 Tax=Yersinia mollaretii TaxID=33060 RepID=UPI0011A934A4|nr:baseplate J/gp47 family protein [Yersinia mollaretii]
MIPRGNLPPIHFAEKSPSAIVSDAVSVFEKLSDITLAPADPRRVFIESLCALIVQQRMIIDFAARQNLLSYATNEYLDALGYLLGVRRLGSQSSITTLKLVLSMAQPGVYIVPVGTQFTHGTLIFESTELLQIPRGSLSGEVKVKAMIPGVASNGLLPGQINTLVTPLPFVESVSNMTTTSGGADIEDDENFAERIHLAPDSFSVAGPEEAYQYWTRSVNQLIRSVSVVSPSPGMVEVRPLLASGDLPSEDLLREVREVLSASAVRPLTDCVKVLSPTIIPYKLNCCYWISTTNKSRAADIQSRAEGAVQTFLLWQRSEQGRDINPDQLTALLKNAGVKRVDISSPVFTVIGKTEVAQESQMSVKFMGVEDG